MYKLIITFTVVSDIFFFFIAHFTAFLGTVLKSFLWINKSHVQAFFPSFGTLLPFFLTQKEHLLFIFLAQIQIAIHLDFACSSSLIPLHDSQFITSLFPV